LAGVLVSIRSALAEVATLSAQRADISKRVALDGDPDPGAVRYKTIIVAASTDRIDVAVRRDDPCFIMDTSGKTGYPEGVVLTHDTVTFAVLNPIIDLLQLGLGERPFDGGLFVVLNMCGGIPLEEHLCRVRAEALFAYPIPAIDTVATDSSDAAASRRVCRHDSGVVPSAGATPYCPAAPSHGATESAIRDMYQYYREVMGL
jgi:hypothetical protein